MLPTSNRQEPSVHMCCWSSSNPPTKKHSSSREATARDPRASSKNNNAIITIKKRAEPKPKPRSRYQERATNESNSNKKRIHIPLVYYPKGCRKKPLFTTHHLFVFAEEAARCGQVFGDLQRVEKTEREERRRIPSLLLRQVRWRRSLQQSLLNRRGHGEKKKRNKCSERERTIPEYWSSERQAAAAEGSSVDGIRGNILREAPFEKKQHERKDNYMAGGFPISSSPWITKKIISLRV